MTLPSERTNAILWAERFLRSLVDPKFTPRIPRALRREALDVLRHYPRAHDLRRPAESLEPTRAMTDEEFVAATERDCECGHQLTQHYEWGDRLGRGWAVEALECTAHGCTCPRFEQPPQKLVRNKRTKEGRRFWRGVERVARGGRR